MHLSWAAAIALALPADAPARYPRPELLIEPAELAKSAKQYRVVDARPKAKYDAGHVPGAVRADPEEWAKAFAKSQKADEWGRRIGALGIDNRTRVVVYDDVMAKDAARVWWILRYFGARDVRLLNGGWPAWKSAGMPASTEETPPAPASFAAEPKASRLATKDEILKQLGKGGPQIIDTRSEGEYCGDTKLAKRGGAIPGAMHLEWTEALDKQTQRFKPAPELRKLLTEAGIDVGKPAVTYCQSGGRAAVMAFTLELMGGKEVANYYRSWSEWGNAEDTPVVRRKAKGR